MTKSTAAVVIGIACLVLTARPAAAEWLADVYVGASLSDKHDVNTSNSGGPATFRKVEFDTTLAYGGRFGRYFDFAPFFGFAVDLFNFSPHIGPQSVRVNGCLEGGGCAEGRTVGMGSFDVNATAISLDLMLRLPLLKTPDAPGGRIQPYIAAGTPVFLTTIEARNTRLFRNADGDSDVTWGYKGAAGVGVYVFKNLMVFGEYRYTHFEPEVELRDSAARRTNFKTEITSHSALLGLSARW